MQDILESKTSAIFSVLCNFLFKYNGFSFFQFPIAVYIDVHNQVNSVGFRFFTIYQKKTTL